MKGIPCKTFAKSMMIWLLLQRQELKKAFAGLQTINQGVWTHCLIKNSDVTQLCHSFGAIWSASESFPFNEWWRIVHPPHLLLYWTSNQLDLLYPRSGSHKNLIPFLKEENPWGIGAGRKSSNKLEPQNWQLPTEWHVVEKEGFCNGK